MSGQGSDADGERIAIGVGGVGNDSDLAVFRGGRELAPNRDRRSRSDASYTATEGAMAKVGRSIKGSRAARFVEPPLSCQARPVRWFQPSSPAAHFRCRECPVPDPHVVNLSLEECITAPAGRP